jgi:SAM-dependent methyltransferase
MKLVLELGEHPPAQRFLTEDQLVDPEPTAPLDAWVCLDCALLQIEDNVPPGFFSHYLYVSSTSDRLVRHFGALADTLVERFVTEESRRVVDIGSCDGVLLEACRKRGAEPLGIEPAANLAGMAREKGLAVVNAYFSVDVAREVREAGGPVAAVTMSNTFNIIDDLDAVVEGVRHMLAEDGVFVVEVPQAADLIEGNEFDTIYHEHLSEFSVHSLKALFERHDMEIFDLESLTLHGGSMRAFVQKGEHGRPVADAVGQALEREVEAGLFEEETYGAFRTRVERNRDDFRRLVRGLKEEGGRIAGYGAAAKGTTLLNYYGIGPDTMDWIADRNELKHGLFSPGMHIPVVPPSRVLQDRPDYLVILAWNFAEEIMAQQEEFRLGGGRFILPVPTTRLVE